MKKKMLETMLEVIEDIQEKYEKILKDFEKIVSSTDMAYSLSIKHEEVLSKILKEIETQKKLLSEINDKVLINSDKIESLGSNIQNQENIKKVISSLLYDFQTLKNKNEKQIGLLENKIALLESKIRLGKSENNNKDLKDIVTPLNELKDTFSITMKTINSKVSDLYKRIDVLEDKQKIYEIFFVISTSNDKNAINSMLEELKSIVAEMKKKQSFDQAIEEKIKQYLDSLKIFWSEFGYNDIAQLFSQKKIEIENL